MMESLMPSSGTNPGGIRRCILAEVSIKKSKGIVGGILDATNPETITIKTLQDAHGRIHEEETIGEVSYEISERIPKEVPE